jgi:hypothetical protein
MKNIEPGTVYNKLTILGFAPDTRDYLLCRCDCGTEKIIHRWNLVRGTTKSCGCLLHVKRRSGNYRHGCSATRLYHCWRNMHLRCYDPASKSFSIYGAKGVKVCAEWSEPPAFFAWAKENGYADNLTLERKNNNGNYEPSNCSWATRKQQSRNRSHIKFYTAFGETKILPEWAEDSRCEPSYKTLATRVRSGWNIEKAIVEPVAKRE